MYTGLGVVMMMMMMMMWTPAVYVYDHTCKKYVARQTEGQIDR